MHVSIRKINTVIFGRTAFWAMVSAGIMFILIYIYFINAIVWHVTDRQKAERKLTDLTAQMASLESAYVNLTATVNIDNAYLLGFKDISTAQTIFIKRSATLGSLTMRQVQ